ncbi:MAG: hypothetical protein KatS3mg085_487 [Candidatus Dojkabacteria bacterium]|nr:MAG: hypothetical protein KatS3mg085_487 [Candidatus Dojkabacteria bacterium]
MKVILSLLLGAILGAGGYFYVNNFLLPTNSKSEESVWEYSFEKSKYTFSPSEQPIIKNIEVKVGETHNLVLDNIKISSTYTNQYSDFIKIKQDQIEINGIKENYGSKFIDIPLQNSNQKLVLEIKTTLPPVDWTKLENDIRNFLGDQQNQYGIMIYDLKRHESLGLNETQIFPPASSAKITVAILVLRDIEAGKYTLDTTYPVQAKYKHSNFDAIGSLPEGTPVTIRKYLEELIMLSSNTAWYHLVHMLGDSYEGVNPRTIEELGVNPLFLDPYQSTASNFVKVMSDVYYNKTLNEESKSYFFDLMRNATQFNREGVGLGVPPNVDFVNKLGYHWTYDLINFNDVAIVFGEKTDYAIAIIDENIDWTTGKYNIKEISSMVYSALN